MCSPSTPSQTQQTTVSELPEWAKPYAKSTLSRADALTDPTNPNNQYKPYGGQRVAGFTDLQNQSFEGAKSLGPSQSVTDATNMTNQIGNAASGLNYQNNNFNGGMFNQDAANHYMNPYVQNALNPQMAQIARFGDQAKLSNAGKAAGAGAFGGSRFGIQNAMTDFNTQQAQSQAYGTGMQNAYSNAQQQFNADAARNMQAQQATEQSRQFGANYGLQGMQTGLQAANQLGQLGQTQFNQQKDTLGVQNAYGTQQQQQNQRPMDIAYQDFQNEQNYPYKQIGFMSDILHGTPTGSSSATNMYQTGPTGAQTLAAAGAGAYGLSKLGGLGGGSGTPAKEGGLMQSYAAGGSVTSPEAVADFVHKLSTQQLQQIIANPTSQVEFEAAQDELDSRSSMTPMAGSISSAASDQMVDNVMPTEQSMARGGIVSFAGGSKKPVSAADISQQLIDQPLYEGPTETEQRQGITSGMNLISDLQGPSLTEPFSKELADKRAALKAGTSRQEGLSVLAALPDIVAPGGFVRGAAAGLAKYGGQMSKFDEMNQAADNLLLQSQVSIASANQARKDGQVGKAVDMFNTGQQQKVKGMELKQQAMSAAGQIKGGLENAQTGANANIQSALIHERAAKYGTDNPAPNAYERYQKELAKARALEAEDPEKNKGAVARVEADLATYMKNYRGQTTTSENKIRDQHIKIVDIVNKSPAVKSAALTIAQYAGKDVEKLDPRRKAALDNAKKVWEQEYIKQYKLIFPDQPMPSNPLNPSFGTPDKSSGASQLSAGDIDRDNPLLGGR